MKGSCGYKIKLLEKMVNFCDDGIYVTDGHANTIFLNDAYSKITGITKEQVVGRNMKDLVKEKVFDISGSLMVLDKRKEIKIEQTLKSNKIILIKSHPVYNDDGDIEFIITNVKDISKVQGLTKKLALSKNLTKKYESELNYIKNKLKSNDNIIVKDRNMVGVFNTILNVSSFDSSILLTGETGTGKTIIAKLIHYYSKRADKNFIEINCGAIPPSLIESELFGYEKGTFTGALTSGKEGVFELANNSTLFLDEISELSMDCQVKLLNVIENSHIRRVGGSKLIPINVRIIAATNKNLKEMVERKEFREDLYYRINVIQIRIPSLRERKDDIIPLSLSFLNEFNKKYEINKYLSKEVLDAIYRYDWPGNVRELRNLIEQLIVVSREDKITQDSLPSYIAEKIGITDEKDKNLNLSIMKRYENLSLKEATQLFQNDLIDNLFHDFKTQKKVASILKVNPSTINRKIKNTF